MKKDVVTPMLATVERDGRRVEVATCCGPAAVLLPGKLVAYRPVGATVEGTCCHGKLGQ